VPIESFMRLKSNPFFPYVERRIASWIGPENPVALDRPLR
jgi:hypothetical protein